jgi:hypothetical protein
MEFRGEILPMRLTGGSVNHTDPSAETAIPLGEPFGVGTSISVITPAVVIRPIRFPVEAVNQSAPSGDAAMLRGPEPGATGNSVTAPAVVIRPMRSDDISVNQRAPSEPAVIPRGPLPPERAK